MSSIARILGIYLGIGIFTSAVFLAVFHRQCDHIAVDEAGDTALAVGIGLVWPFSIVVGLVTVIVIVASRWIERLIQ